MLGSLPPEVLSDVQMCGQIVSLLTNCDLFLFFFLSKIMQALVEHYSSKGWLQRVEQCVLHMDISSLDFNQVLLLSLIIVFLVEPNPFAMIR